MKPLTENMRDLLVRLPGPTSPPAEPRYYDVGTMRALERRGLVVRRSGGYRQTDAGRAVFR